MLCCIYNQKCPSAGRNRSRNFIEKSTCPEYQSSSGCILLLCKCIPSGWHDS
jgi:hypothetical protein